MTNDTTEGWAHDVFERMHRIGEYEAALGKLPDPPLWNHRIEQVREGYRAGFRFGQRLREQKLRKRNHEAGEHET
jgi:hypothetical protein